MRFGGTEDEAAYLTPPLKSAAHRWGKKVATMEEKGNKEARIMMCVENLSFDHVGEEKSLLRPRLV